MQIHRKSLLAVVSILFGAILSAQTLTEFPPPAGTQPWDITTGPDGNLWFTYRRSGTLGVARMTTDGAVTEFAIAADRLSVPSGSVAAGPDGNLWIAVTDFDGFGLIGRMNPVGRYSEFQLSSGWGALDIIAGPDRNLWFTAEGNSIGRIGTDGAATNFPIPTAQSQPSGIAAGSDGNLWFTERDGNRIGRITTSGVITEFPIPTGSSEPTGITAGPDGNLWFVEWRGQKIGRITTTGVISEFVVPTPGSRPLDICAGVDGNLWFTEFDAKKIGRITTDGVITEFPIPSTPLHITTGPDGNLWFTGGGKIGRLAITRAPAIDSRILPVVGSTVGVGGSFFRTAVQLHNPTAAPMAGRIVFHPSGASGESSDPGLSYSLSPGQTQSIADLLPAMGRFGLGSADIEVTAGAVPSATIRVFNDAGAAGTTGFTEEPMRADDALRPEVSGALLVPADPTRFRFNLGVRTLESGSTATLTLRDASGAVVKTVSREFPATFHEQRSAGEFLGVSTLPAGGSIGISMTAGSAIFYGATVDNTTGDPSLQVARPAQR